NRTRDDGNRRVTGQIAQLDRKTRIENSCNRIVESGRAVDGDHWNLSSVPYSRQRNRPRISVALDAFEDRKRYGLAPSGADGKPMRVRAKNPPGGRRRRVGEEHRIDRHPFLLARQILPGTPFKIAIRFEPSSRNELCGRNE